MPGAARRAGGGPSSATRATSPATLGPFDLAYLDPPYNQHRYFTNYHIWETLVAWDAPEHYGVACKRVDARDATTKSVFNDRRAHARRARARRSRGVDARLVVRVVQRRGVGADRRARGDGRGARRARCARSRSTRSATSARRSGSTTRRARRSAQCPACATSSTSSSRASPELVERAIGAAECRSRAMSRS